MTTSTQTTTRGRGRPRTPGADARVLKAALAEYADRGWAGFTMDGVARRAKVGKSTLYLRWTDKNTLLLEAVTSHSESVCAVDTGSLRGDLESLALNLFRLYTGPTGWASLRLAVDATAIDSPWRATSEEVFWSRLEGIRPMFDRAVGRGEIDPRVDCDDLVHGVCGSITMQALRRDVDADALSDEDLAARARRTVDFLLSGAAAQKSA